MRAGGAFGGADAGEEVGGDAGRRGVTLRDAEAACHEALDGFLAGAAGADLADDLVDVADGEDHALEDVGALAGLLQQEGGASADDLGPVVDVAVDELEEAHRAGALAGEGEVDDREGVLQRGELVELLLDDRGVGALLELDDDAGLGLAAGLVAHIGHAGDAVVLDGLGDLLDHGFEREVVGDRVDHELLTVLAKGLDADRAADLHLAAAGEVGLDDAALPVEHAAGGEVGALDAVADDVAFGVGDVAHEFIERDGGVVDDADDAVEDLGGILRREAGGHADGDADAAVDEQVGEAPGQHGGLEQTLVVVGLEVDGAEVDVGEQVDRGAGHARFGVAHGGGRIAVDGAEVALRVDERDAHAPALGHVDQGGVDDALAVRVVIARGLAGDLRALDVLAAGAEVEVVHRDEDASLAGLETVADIGQRPVHDRAHGVGEVAVLELALDVEFDDVAGVVRGGRAAAFVGCRCGFAALLFSHAGALLRGRAQRLSALHGSPVRMVCRRACLGP